ncbi:hypothetical protein SUGI_0241020 [Cryptomeria japonica]|nr:hypothetical protein SUGI_0241020 [Cryptomeria japonica]
MLINQPKGDVRTTTMAGRKISHTHMKIITRAIFVLCLFQSVAYFCVAEDENVIRALLESSKAMDKNQSVLTSWKEDTDPCKWTGITCKGGSHVTHIVLEGLQLNGTLDSKALCQVKTLRVLSLQDIGIQGPLSSDISACTNIQRIYLRNNKLSGPIPEELTGLNRLQLLDLSNNYFSGPVPAFNGASITLDISGNPALCGGPQMQQCSIEPAASPVTSHRKKRAAARFAMWAGYVALAVTLLFVFTFIFLHRKKYYNKIEAKVEKVRSGWSATPSKATTPGTMTPSKMNKSSEFLTSMSSEYAVSMVDSKSTSLVFLDERRKGMKFEELLRSSAELLGRGGLGSLYRVVLYDGSSWVVKRIRDIRVPRQDFERRMALIGRLKHPNVLPLVAYYCSKEEKLLVYDHLRNGSISTLLHGHFEDKKLDWQTRLAVASGVAHGLAYLHHQNPNSPHANLKSSNILLNDKYEPCISEYGLFFLLDEPAGISPGQWSGYKAPEYNQTKRFTHKSDVYSFGIMLLELLTGKPVDSSGLDLPRWVTSVVREEWTVEVFDQSMVQTGSHSSEDRMVQLLRIAVSCVSNNPASRPVMAEVSRLIDKLKEAEEQSIDQSYMESSSTSTSYVSGNATPDRTPMSVSR